MDGWSRVRPEVVDFRRCVFLSNVYSDSFSICTNFRIMNRQISLEGEEREEG